MTRQILNIEAKNKNKKTKKKKYIRPTYVLLILSLFCAIMIEFICG